MNYVDIRRYDTSNWSGINSTLFVSGCHFHCPGCFNKEAQDFNYGKLFDKTAEDLFISYIKDPHVQGVNLLGGEIFHQDLDIILNLVKRITEETKKPIYCWTGFIWEDLIQIPKAVEILKYIKVLIDGKFEEDKKNLMLKHKGSSNQREINVQESLKSNKVILIRD
ncbi:MAG: anaerobic ribonucleoside-triphosphate reductase activating protein [Bacilli bacterium]|nr:anaerobic ribonucleoside-triphosphate reductase activating protein [Bacilli bacterium]